MDLAATAAKPHMARGRTQAVSPTQKAAAKRPTKPLRKSKGRVPRLVLEEDGAMAIAIDWTFIWRVAGRTLKSRPLLPGNSEARRTRGAMCGRRPLVGQAPSGRESALHDNA